MKEENTFGEVEKKLWNTPIIFSLKARKTESGPYTEQREDLSGDQDTSPNS
jgi:hypothetical protein